MLALLALSAMAVYTYLYSAAFRLQRMEITGHSRLTAADIQLAAGVAAGDLQWQHPPDEVRRRLLESSLGLVDARVEWQPGGVLAIAVAERQPVAVLPYYNLFALVDGEGVILALSQLTEHSLPFISGIPLSRGLLGERVAHPHLEPALRAARLLPEPVRADLAEVHVAPSGELTLVFNGPIQATLGPPSQLEEKLTALLAVYDTARAGGYNIDLRRPVQANLIPRG